MKAFKYNYEDVVVFKSKGNTYKGKIIGFKMNGYGTDNEIPVYSIQSLGGENKEYHVVSIAEKRIISKID